MFSAVSLPWGDAPLKDSQSPLWKGIRMAVEGDVEFGTIAWGLGQSRVIVIPELSASHRNFRLTLPAGPSPGSLTALVTLGCSRHMKSSFSQSGKT